MLVPKKNAPSKLEAVNIYVDGSYQAETKAMGFGFVAMDSSEGFIIHQEACPVFNTEYEETTNCGLELLAVIRSVMWAERRGFKHIKVFHDYRGIRTLANHKRPGHRSPLFNFFKEFIKLRMQYRKKGIKVFLTSVPSHSGNLGNEIADRLARAGMLAHYQNSVSKSWVSLLKRWYHLANWSLPSLALQNYVHSIKLTASHE